MFLSHKDKTFDEYADDLDTDEEDEDADGQISYVIENTHEQIVQQFEVPDQETESQEMPFPTEVTNQNNHTQQNPRSRPTRNARRVLVPISPATCTQWCARVDGIDIDSHPIARDSASTRPMLALYAALTAVSENRVSNPPLSENSTFSIHEIEENQVTDTDDEEEYLVN